MTSPNVQPSPDLSGYVDLRIYDLTDQEIVEGALGMLALNLPGYVAREGHTEVMLLESFALEMAEAIVAVNRLPGAVVEAILLLAGVTRDLGEAPTATATITVADAVGYTIPPGTRLYLSISTGETATFLVEPPGLEIAPGNTSGTVSIIGDEFTSLANGQDAPTPLVLADPVPFVESAELASEVIDGRDPETDEEWRDRGVARLSRLSDALVTEAHFQAAALERPEVGRALAIDLWDGSGGVPGDDPGHITVALLGDDGNVLSAPTKAEIETELEARAVAMLDVHLVDIVKDPVDVTAEIHLLDGADATSVSDAVEEMLVAYLDPLTWDWGAIVRLNELIALIDRIDGVDYVDSVLINGVAANLDLSAPQAVPDADVITVTVI